MIKVLWAALACVVLTGLASGPVLAAASDPERRANVSQSGSDDKSRRKAAKKETKVEFFGDRHRAIVADYYNEQIGAGNCPLGFSKAEGGCIPPTRPSQWAVGKPLPKDAVRFDVPAAIVAKFGKPPTGHRYVRVGADTLLVSNRTGMVVDGIRDLGRK